MCKITVRLAACVVRPITSNRRSILAEADQPSVAVDTNPYKVLTLIERTVAVIYTYEDVELRRIFPSEFPQDTVRRSGSVDPEYLGRYGEIKSYFKNPKHRLNTHFEELACYEQGMRKVCSVDLDRYSPEEDNYYSSMNYVSHLDRRRVFCLMLLCFTEDELDRVVASF